MRFPANCLVKGEGHYFLSFRPTAWFRRRGDTPCDKLFPVHCCAAAKVTPNATNTMGCVLDVRYRGSVRWIIRLGTWMMYKAKQDDVEENVDEVYFLRVA